MNKKNWHEDHHVIPISLWGINRRCNIARILKYDHDKIHDTLNLAHNCIRSLRKKESECIISWDIEWYLIAQHNAQKLYLDNLDHLSWDIIKIHSDKLQETIQMFMEINQRCAEYLTRQWVEANLNWFEYQSHWKQKHEQILKLRLLHEVLKQKSDFIKKYRSNYLVKN